MLYCIKSTILNEYIVDCAFPIKTLGVNSVWEESFLFFYSLQVEILGLSIMMFLTDRMLISTCGVTLQSAFGKLTINICSR